MFANSLLFVPHSSPLRYFYVAIWFPSTQHDLWESYVFKHIYTIVPDPRVLTIHRDTWRNLISFKHSLCLCVIFLTSINWVQVIRSKNIYKVGKFTLKLLLIIFIENFSFYLCFMLFRNLKYHQNERNSPVILDFIGRFQTSVCRFNKCIKSFIYM